MDRIDGFLSKRIQTVIPEGLVKDTESAEGFVLEITGETDKLVSRTGLGKTFQEAKAAVEAMVSAYKARENSNN
jgi:hypothetical protein